MEQKKKKTQSKTDQGCDEDLMRLLSSCVEQSNEGIAATDIDGNLLFINRAFANLHGYEPEELVGKDLSIFHNEDQLAQVQKANEILRETGTFSGEIWHTHRNGHVFPTHMLNTLRRDDDGTPLGMIGSMRDITDLKEVENALRQSENHFRTIFQTVPDTITISRLSDGLYIDANEGFFTTTGYTRDEVIGRSALDLKMWHDPADRDKLVKALEETGRMDNLESVFVTKNDKQITGLMSARIIVLNGEPHLIAVTRDITERQRQQAALRESEEKFRQLAETTEAAIFIFQGENNVYANPAAQIITGYSLDEIRGSKFWELIHPDFRDIVRTRGMERQQGEEHPSGYEVQILRKDGDTRWVEYAGAQIIFQGQPAILGTAFDITDRKTTEERLKQTTIDLENERKALTEKNVALSQILSHIEQERIDYKDTICRQVDEALKPLLQKLRNVVPDTHESEIDAIEMSLEGILSKDVDVFQDNYSKLTPREMEICELIQQGNSSKQISSVLHLSLLTIHKHREQIRDKLELTNKSINLSSFLRSH